VKRSFLRVLLFMSCRVPHIFALMSYRNRYGSLLLNQSIPFGFFNIHPARPGPCLKPTDFVRRPGRPNVPPLVSALPRPTTDLASSCRGFFRSRSCSRVFRLDLRVSRWAPRDRRFLNWVRPLETCVCSPSEKGTNRPFLRLVPGQVGPHWLNPPVLHGGKQHPIFGPPPLRFLFPSSQVDRQKISSRQSNDYTLFPNCSRCGLSSLRISVRPRRPRGVRKSWKLPKSSDPHQIS